MENPLYLVMVLKSHGKPIVFSDGPEKSWENPLYLVMVVEKSWKTHCI